MTVWGEKDIVIPVSQADIIRCKLIGGSVRVMPECGNWLNMERSDEFNAVFTGLFRGSTVYGRGPAIG